MTGLEIHLLTNAANGRQFLLQKKPFRDARVSLRRAQHGIKLRVGLMQATNARESMQQMADISRSIAALSPP